MTNMKGWLKLYRKIFENPLVTRSPEHLAVWMYLLCHATPKPYRALFAGKEIELRPGQLITGRRAVGECVNSKISESKVHRVLKDFENAHQIEQQTSNKNRLITIVNWGAYQNSERQSEQQPNNSRTTTEQQPNTYREEKEKKEEKESKKPVELSIDELWELTDRRSHHV